MKNKSLKSSLQTALKNSISTPDNNRTTLPLGFSLSKAQLHQLKKLADKQQRSLNEVIDEAIGFYLEFQVELEDEAFIDNV
ncbi:ribbon-helix-helix domain-containing protein [Algivirga pacifica]|uniref:Ribbon-helix-helix protein CopG domain-containing protein n=1 Tax=Algivirga pacifica TaxID=1162670 RepID=A0ABP9D7J3_9BACT